MKRRDFFKDCGFFALGGTLGACSCKISNEKSLTFEKDDDGIKYEHPDWVNHIEFLITHHCNLNCASCNYFSPLANEYYMPLDIFEKDLEQLSKITDGNLEELVLSGGEPLLNKNIEKYMKTARKYFNKSYITIKTNALLLNKMNDTFWQTCNKKKISIRYNEYPLHKNYPNLEAAHKKAIKYKVKLIPLNRPAYKVQKIQLKKNILQNPETNFRNCENKTKSILNNGYLYPCNVFAGVDLFFNKYFKNNTFKISSSDYLIIYEISLADEINNFLRKPKEFCRYCSRNNKNFWELSKKNFAEWCKI